MTNIINLTKIYFYEIFGSLFSKVSKKRKVASKGLFVALFAMLIFGLVCFNMFVSFDSMSAVLTLGGMGNYILYYAAIYFNMIGLMFLSYETQDLFFKTKDYNLLSSMPIKSYQIIISKIFTLLLISYLFELAVMIPAYVVYFGIVGFSAWALVLGIICFFALPVYLIFFSTVFAWLINLIATKTRNKQKTNMSLTIVFMFIVLILFLVVNFIGLDEIIKVGGVPAILNWIFPTTTLMFYGVDGASLLYVGLNVLVNLVLFAISVLLLAKFYFSINQGYINKAKALKVKKQENFEVKSVFARLFNMEVKNFLDKPIYIFNSIFGMALLLIGVVGVPIYYYNNLATFALIPKEMAVFIAAMMPSSLTLLTATSCSSISLEGQAIYFKKSLPISFGQIAWSKILLNLVLGLPIILFYLATIPIMMDFNFVFVDYVLVLFSPIISLLFVSIFGLLVNLWLPKLNWTNVVSVVKQSGAVMVTVLFGVVIASFVFSVFFAANINPTLFLAIYLAVISLLTILVYALLMTLGKKLYNKL